jgi:Uncharacterized protein conserved in bacteria (DUF2066)
LGLALGDVVRRGAASHWPRLGRLRDGGLAHRAGLPVAALAFGLSSAVSLPAYAASTASLYKVAKYPVQAQAEDAVTAKAQALADGQQGAFRSLLKRLVPVTAYKKLPKLPLARVQDMISGFSVRSERNSSTEYLGSYDFEFQPRAVRELLRSSGVPMIEETAQPTVVISVYGAPVAAQSMAPAKAGKSQPTSVGAALPAHLQPARVAPVWTKAWGDLDTENALTPVRMAKTSGEIPEDTLRSALAGDSGALRGLSGSESNERVVLAYAVPVEDGRKLAVTLTGRDAVGPFTVTRTYPVLDGDVAYATELAAVVGLGILEGRWKALKSSRPANSGTVSADGVDGWAATTDRAGKNDGIATSQPTSGGWTDDIEFVVEFRGLGQWRQMRERLNETPGVEDLEVGQMSARTASVKLRYPGGAERLANDLSAQGMQLSNQGGSWVLQSR